MLYSWLPMHITKSGVYVTKVLSGGCISATKVREMANYVDKLINVYTKMNMPVYNDLDSSI